MSFAILATSAQAFDATFGKVATERLNLRAGPSTSAKVVSELPEGSEVVMGGERSGDWIKVLTVVNGVAVVGWVNGRLIAPTEQTTLSLPSTRSPVPPPAAPIPSSNPYPLTSPRYKASPLEITDSDLRCREGIALDGYERCELSVSVVYQGDQDVSGSFNVSCTATAELGYQGDILGRRRTFDDSATIWVSNGYGSTTVEITMRPYFSVEPLVSVEVREVECRYGRY